MLLRIVSVIIEYSIIGRLNDNGLKFYHIIRLFNVAGQSNEAINLDKLSLRKQTMTEKKEPFNK